MSFTITDDCVCCIGMCTSVCPTGAIYNDGEKNAIDQTKCTSCGRCQEVCALSAVVDTDVPAAKPLPHGPIRKNCDVLIIGAGGSGLIAAARSAYLSKKKVIVLEKEKKTGGSGWYSARVSPYASKWQIENGGVDNTDDYVRAAINTTFGEVNPKLIANAYRARNEFFDWYCEWGEIDKYYDMNAGGMAASGFGGAPGFGMSGPMIMQKPYKKGNLLMTQTYEYCKKLGVEFLTECRAEEFIMKDEAVTGVIASDPGGKVIISCKACLLAAGGLVANKQLVAKCIPAYADAYQSRSPHARPGSTGDSVVMGEKAGIPIDYDNICVAFIGEMGGGSNPRVQMHNTRPELLKINLNGERWYNEHAYREGCSFGLLKQPKCEAWLVMDTKIANMEPLPKKPVLRDANNGRMMMTAVPNEDGSPKTPAAIMQLGPDPGMPFKSDPNSGPATDALEAEAKLKGRNVVRADTLEELAVKMGVPVNKFLATVKRYNELCAKGHDDDFFKHPCYLIPIGQGPFYAIHNHLAHDGVFGGFYIDENMAVLSKNGRPIPGLFASGDNTSSRFILRGEQRIEIMNDYPWALSSGFVAANSMAKYVAD